MSRALLLLFMLLAPVAAGATPYEAAAAMYHDGAFLEAAQAGEALGTADGLALAARAVSVHAGYVAPKKDRIKNFGRALRLANRARALEPDYLEGLLQAVTAMGRLARAKGLIRSYFNGYAAKSKDMLDRALVIGPDSKWTHVLLGAWHAEIVGLAPGFMVKGFGADSASAVRHFERALEIDPENPVLWAEYAGSMRIMRGRKGRERVLELYRRAVALEPRDAFETLVRDRAVAGLELLTRPAGRTRRRSR